MPDYSLVLARIANLTYGPGENHWKGFCPVCQGDHRRRSLRLWITNRDRLACKCYRSHCSFADVAAALQTNQADWFPDEPNRRKGRRKTMVEIVDTYDYTDEDGKLLFQVQRTKKAGEKGFRCRRPIPGATNEWSWNLGAGFYTGEAGGYWSFNTNGNAGPNCLDLPAVRMVPWLLHELAAKPYAPIIVVEGEKDAKTIKEALKDTNTLTTTSRGRLRTLAAIIRWLPVRAQSCHYS